MDFTDKINDFVSKIDSKLPFCLFFMDIYIIVHI